MQTKIGLVVGVQLFLIGIIVLFADPSKQMSEILAEFIGDVNQTLWASMNIFAGALIMWPGPRWRPTRYIIAALIPLVWAVISVYPQFSQGGIDRISPIGVVLWVGLSVLIVMDRKNIIFHPELHKYHDYHKENRNG